MGSWRKAHTLKYALWFVQFPFKPQINSYSNSRRGGGPKIEEKVKEWAKQGAKQLRARREAPSQADEWTSADQKECTFHPLVHARPGARHTETEEPVEDRLMKAAEAKRQAQEVSVWVLLGTVLP